LSDPEVFPTPRNSLLGLADPVGRPRSHEVHLRGRPARRQNEGGISDWVDQDRVDSMAVLTEATVGNAVRRIR
jgi:hypothetical protein